MNVKDRIIEVLRNKDISVSKAEAQLGWSKGALQKANSISSDRLGEFIIHFKDVSPKWLLTGEGNRYRNDVTVDVTGSSPPTIDFRPSVKGRRTASVDVTAGMETETDSELMKTNVFLSNQVRRLTEELEEARERIEELNGKISEMEAGRKKA